MARFTRIVCPVDLSEWSQRAVDHAMAIAHWHGAQVFVLHVHQLVAPALVAAPALAAESFQVIRLSDGERAQLEAALRARVTADAAAGVSVSTAVVEEFNVPDTIVSYAEDVGADLITVATHGRSGFKRFVLGSVAEHLLRAARCPVLVVPPHVHDAVPRAPVAYQRIVCPVDFSDASVRSLSVATSLAAEAGGRVTAVHIVETPPELADLGAIDFSDYRAESFEHGRRALKGLTTPLQAVCGIDELVLVGKPAPEILRLAADQQADVIVMGIQGRGAVDRLLFGSVCQHVVREADCPVLTVHGE